MSNGALDVNGGSSSGLHATLGKLRRYRLG